MSNASMQDKTAELIKLLKITEADAYKHIINCYDAAQGVLEHAQQTQLPR